MPGKVSCCEVPSGDVCCLGQWSGPYELDIACDRDPDCSGGCENRSDEVSHAALIPVGTWNDGQTAVPLRGKVLVWTQCDAVLERGSGGFYTHVWDSGDPASVNPGLRGDIIPAVQAEGGYSVGNDGPFCAGHTWMLDENGQSKLLVVGGQHRGIPGMAPLNPACPTAVGCGLHTAYWFDPNAADGASAWEDGPDELSWSDPFVGLWYPSVSIFYDGAAFRPIVLGGSGLLKNRGARLVGGCDRFFDLNPMTHDGDALWAYRDWWTLSPQGTPAPSYDGAAWQTHIGAPDTVWQTYPRLLQLSTGKMIAIGGAVVCEKPLPDYETLAPGAGNDTEYGPPPVSLLTVTTPTHSRDFGPDPNTQDPSNPGLYVGAWHYNNVVLLHTLTRKDRVIAFGGTDQFVKGDDVYAEDVFETDALSNVLELDVSTDLWHEKAQPIANRVFANAVVLPDRTILHVGGQNNGDVDFDNLTYYDVPERFDPGSLQQPGEWRSMAPRIRPGGKTIPRAYHSNALLLQDGRVALLGGAPGEDPNLYYRSDDTAEIYSPPYVFETARLKITGMQPGSMIYGAPDFCIQVNTPADVSHAVLMGIGSVTHSFDYGQRYVELATTTTGCPGYNIRVVPPTNPAEVPEGYYLLFVVEDRNGTRVPCVKARFVKVTS